jgi:PKD domain
MRLARRALFAALTSLFLLAAVTGQTLRPGNDPRNQSPSVGTGGPEGGPTGLFTIYDGDTLRRGEFTFSVAYSNYDRDPGNVDITEVPLSFNIGISDHIELFFKTTGYRGIKVNSPLNLSSFYLPNSQVFFSSSLLGSPPAIILAPSGPNVGTLAGQSLFRPAFNQPFVQFPFVGGTAGTFGLANSNGSGTAGFPGFNAQLGAAVGSGGNFSTASFFPGIGSPIGSILPGVVLATTTLPPTALTTPITVPVSFTTQPSYLPDAPFINRLYGQTSFTNLVFGAKIRFTGPNNALGAGLIPFWRYWLDKPNDFQGFNQMQRGAGPGSSIGDFGLVGFVSGRLSRSVNVSSNLGVILNSNPKSDAFGTKDAVLLDRPNELLAGVGFDFPINKHFQPIAELKSVQYWGSKTPNAFPQNPVDFLAGVKIYPRRWFGFGAWYRVNLNQQSQGHFNTGTDFNAQINQLSGVFVPTRGVVIVPGTTRPATANGLPLGFRFSDDPHGFGFQFFAGHRNARLPTVFPNQPPTVTLTAASSTVVLPASCGADQHPDPSCSPTATTVALSATATDPDGDTLLYTWSTTGGRVTGDGPNATLDLTGVSPGTYTTTVEVDDGCGCIAFTSTTVTVTACTCVANPTPQPCPTVRVSCVDTAGEGQPITFTANVSGGSPNVTPTYNWTVSAGTISSGQGTSSITVDTKGLGGQSVTATVDVGGYDRSCSTSSACTTAITKVAVARKVDEYGNIRFNDEKARLDNFAIELQNDPTSQGYLICYGGRRGRAGEGQARCDRAKNYLVTTRGIDASRVVTVDGGYREDLTVELWVVPSGANPPTASPTVDPSEVKATAAPRRGRRRGHDDDDE